MDPLTAWTIVLVFFGATALIGSLAGVLAGHVIISTGECITGNCDCGRHSDRN